MTAQQVVDAYREARETLEADPQYGRAALPEHWARFDGLEIQAVNRYLAEMDCRPMETPEQLREHAKGVL